MERIAIVGAGVSGAAAAYALRDEDGRVAILEKSRGYSGRAATRRREKICYDHGANYFEADDEEVNHIVHQELSVIGLARIEPDVWTFDDDGTIHEGDPDSNETPRWTYRTGIHRLGKRLALGSEADIHLETRIEHMREEDDGRWRLIDQREEEHGAYNSVLFTCPAPQTAELLRSAETLDADLDPFVKALDAVSYRSQITVVLGYDEPLERPDPFYGLVNTEGGHDVAWLSFEEDKPGHVPGKKSVVVVQMSPGWSTSRLDDSPEDYVQDAAQAVADLLGTDAAADPAWTDAQAWRYALPDDTADADVLDEGADVGLFFAGDALVGEGRVQQALKTGLAVAERIPSED